MADAKSRICTGPLVALAHGDLCNAIRKKAAFSRLIGRANKTDNKHKFLGGSKSRICTGPLVALVQCNTAYRHQQFVLTTATVPR